MLTLEDTVKALITELTRIQAPGSIPERDGNRSAIPGLIPVGNNGSLFTSREMERLIEIVARELKGNNPLMARTHTDREWHSTVTSGLRASSSCH